MEEGEPLDWQRFQKYLYHNQELGLMLDTSKMSCGEAELSAARTLLKSALFAMSELEQGSIANPDEGRMVGHYWLRNPQLAPTDQIAGDIERAGKEIKGFVARIHSGQQKTPSGQDFRKVLLLGIGGSALGPQFVANALKVTKPRMELYFLDNTDPDGLDHTLAEIGRQLAETLVIVISKSGGTVETNNCLLEVRQAYAQQQGLEFSGHCVAITQEGSSLDNIAVSEKWLARFPMWDWVGGRTSVTSAVGLLPAALQGFDIDSLLKGAADCDEATRKADYADNPAAQMAAMWWIATGGQGGTDLVILPYKDRLQLLAKYLQQLIMESLGKSEDLAGQVVHQGLAVFGNKGSTDQHSYVQQLLDGPPNILVTFVEVLKDRAGSSLKVGEDITSGDYLSAFLQGTKRALAERGRNSITLTIPEVNAYTVGVLIALFERTVGLYAQMININAYHQPGVESGKKGANLVITLQQQALAYLRSMSGKAYTAEEIARAIDQEAETELIFKILEHAAHNPDHGVKRQGAEPVYYSKYSG